MLEELKTLVDIAHKKTGVTFEEILSKTRKRKVVDVKRIVSFILKRDNNDYTLEEIANAINSDHSTICHYKRTHEDLLKTDIAFRRKFEYVNNAYLEQKENPEYNLKLKLEERLLLDLEIKKLRLILKRKKEMKWLWPVPSVKKSLPLSNEPGSFGFVRKFDIHTGIDIYCKLDSQVVAVEDGVVMNIEIFTGPNADSPWWNETKAVWVKGTSGIVVYGEIESNLSIGQKLSKGDIIGIVKPVLKKDKGLPMNMLHIELYSPEMNETVWWKLGKDRPANLLDPTSFLEESTI